MAVLSYVVHRLWSQISRSRLEGSVFIYHVLCSIRWAERIGMYDDFEGIEKHCDLLEGTVLVFTRNAWGNLWKPSHKIHIRYLPDTSHAQYCICNIITKGCDLVLSSFTDIYKTVICLKDPLLYAVSSSNHFLITWNCFVFITYEFRSVGYWFLSYNLDV